MKRINSLPQALPHRLKQQLANLLLKKTILRRYTHVRYVGLDIPLDLPILNETIISALLRGTYESIEISRIPTFFSHGERILELGSGLGIVAATVVSRLKDATYQGFEADPQVVAASKKIAELNNIKLDVRNAMLTVNSSDAHADFYRRKSFWASSASVNIWGHEEKVTVPALSFDSVLQSFNPSALICDIEGGEFELLTNSDLQNVQKIVFEIHPSVLGDEKSQVIRNALDSLGFAEHLNLSSDNVLFWSRAK